MMGKEEVEGQEVERTKKEDEGRKGEERKGKKTSRLDAHSSQAETRSSPMNLT